MVAPQHPSDSSSEPSPQAAAAVRKAISRAKLRANRRNAKKSTGPRTDEGKQIASKNSISHGVFCASLCLAGEDMQKLNFIRFGLLDATKPQDLLELSLVDRMVDAQWRLERCQLAEAGMYEQLALQDRQKLQRQMNRIRKEYEFEDLDELETYCRENAHDKDLVDDQLRRALERFREYSQVVDVNPTPAVTLALSMLLSDNPAAESGKRGLERMGRYQQRLHTQFHRALRELEHLRECSKKWEDLPDSPFNEPAPALDLDELEDDEDLDEELDDELADEEAGADQDGGADEAEPESPSAGASVKNEPTAEKTAASASDAGSCADAPRQNRSVRRASPHNPAPLEPNRDDSAR